MEISPVNNNINSIKNRDDRKIKAGVAAMTILSTGTALAHISKKQGFSLIPSVIKKTPIKDWAVFGIYNKKHPNKKLVEIEEKEILELATASVAGGLAGGALFDDKKHLKAKLRESVNQLFGNVAVPVACVSLVSHLYKKNKSGILRAIPQIKETGKVSRNFNSALRAIPLSIATLLSLGVGIVTGNKVSNYINEKIFNKKVDRNIKASDFAPHVDDVGMAVSLMADKTPLSTTITRTVPAFLCVPGIEVGMHRD